MGDFTTVVQRHMAARGMSVRAAARAAGYSDHTLLSKVLNGHKPVTPYLAAKLDRALEAGGEIVAAAQSAMADANAAQGSPCPPSVPAETEQPSAEQGSHSEDIAGLVSWIVGTNTTDDAIEQIERAAVYLAEAHSKVSPQTALTGVLQTHGKVQACLRGGRQRLRQTRELLRIDSYLLSHACLLLGDLGYNRKAAEYGAAALVLAQEAGSDEAAAWSVQAKTARWQDRYVESAELARRGFEAAAPSPIKVELAYREANAIALFGDASRARRALRSAQATAEALPSGRDSGSSVWSFSVARQAIFALSVAIHIGDPDGALRAAAMADAAWASGEPRIPATYAQIQAGSSIAYLMKDSLDGAAHHVAPVLSLPQEARISTVIGYVRKLESLLAQSRFAESEPAVELAHQIKAFMSASPAGTDDAVNK